MNRADEGVGAGGEPRERVVDEGRAGDKFASPALNTDRFCVTVVDRDIVRDRDPILEAQGHWGVGSDDEFAAVEEEITGGDLGI
jgi:hypothetical protein